MCGSRLRSLVVDMVLMVPPRFGWAPAVGAPAAPVVGAASTVAAGVFAAGEAGALELAQPARTVPTAPSAAPRTTRRRERRRPAQASLRYFTVIAFSPPFT